MLILNKKNVDENYLSVKVENFGESPMIKTFSVSNDVKSLINFLENLNFDLRSSATISIFCDSKILILRS